MKRLMMICIVMAGCQPADGAFLSLEPLPAPTTASIGIPVHVIAVGGHGVRLELTQGKFGDDQTVSKCLDLTEPEAETTGVGSEIVVVVPDDVEALMIGRLYERCPDVEGDGSSTLAVAQRALRVVEPNMSDQPAARRSEGGGS